MLLAILYLYFQVGTSDYRILYEVTYTLDADVQKILWLAFYASFAVKFPLVPFHI
jgi:NADH:ubiquinone oxidoreductase subunit 4 (subunit M)